MVKNGLRLLQTRKVIKSMSKVGKLIPKPIKFSVLWIIRRPEKIRNKIYQAAAKGKIPFPDKAFQKWDYKIHSGKRLSFRNPQTFNEKLQWLKYYYHNPLLTQLVDKYEVRKYISERFGEENLTKCYGIYSSWDEIDFTKLPNQFVVKCTHDSGSVYICKDISEFNYDECKKIITDGLSRNQFYLSREWPYKNVKPRIMIEEYLHDDSTDDLIDYKFLCFCGKVRLVFTISDRKSQNGGPFEDFFDLDWNSLPIKHTYNNSNKTPRKPKSYNQMIECANTLSQGLPHVRVDFFEVDGKMYFGEMTFFDSGGRKPFTPESVDKEMGEWIDLPTKMR